MTQFILYFLASLTLTNAAILSNSPYNRQLQRSRDSPRKTGTRLSLADSAEWTEYHIKEPEGPGTYSFGYDVEDPETGNIQFRTEERRPNGTVTGSYGYVATDGSIFVVHYIADALGYRTKIERARVSNFNNMLFKSNKASNDNISPEMLAAIQSLQSKNRLPKEDQHVRPKDQNYPNNNKLTVSVKKEDTNYHPNIDYNVQFVPAKSKYK